MDRGDLNGTSKGSDDGHEKAAKSLRDKGAEYPPKVRIFHQLKEAGNEKVNAHILWTDF